ncbi:hypothetical protein [Flavobacterium silvaticum]|uniref:Uncharacterized protein n=1 Tax=Flavobacterium silvaticum TaxID=1852020 RepID=A0A972JK46_9FLAO|nr:hypothetical protein [Flavobacterium silvaticum]NMH28767.1 hypothetical protein [Flavobacterium silvaticum]
MKKGMHDRVEKLMQEGYELDFNNVLAETKEHFKKTFAWGGLALTVLCMLVVPVVICIMLSVFGIDKLVGKPENITITSLGPGALALYMGFMGLLNTAITPYNAGLIEMNHRADTKNQLDLGTAFIHYGRRTFGNVLLLGVVVSLITTCVSTGVELLHFPGFSTVNIAFSFLFGCFSLLAIPLVIFGEFGPLEALSASFKLISKQFSTIFSLYVLAIFVAISGLLPMFIGIATALPALSIFSIGFIFTLPFLFAFVYTLYKQIVGFPADTTKESVISEQTE